MRGVSVGGGRGAPRGECEHDHEGSAEERLKPELLALGFPEGKLPQLKPAFEMFLDMPSVKDGKTASFIKQLAALTVRVHLGEVTGVGRACFPQRVEIEFHH